MAPFEEYLERGDFSMSPTVTIVLSVYLIVVVLADMAVYFRNRKKYGSSSGLSTARVVCQCIVILAAAVGMVFRSVHTAMFIVLAVTSMAALLLQTEELKKEK